MGCLKGPTHMPGKKGFCRGRGSRGAVSSRVVVSFLCNAAQGTSGAGVCDHHSTALDTTAAVWTSGNASPTFIPAGLALAGIRAPEGCAVFPEEAHRTAAPRWWPLCSNVCVLKDFCPVYFLPPLLFHFPHEHLCPPRSPRGESHTNTLTEQSQEHHTVCNERCGVCTHTL